MIPYTPESLEICTKVVRSINAESGVWGPKCVVIGGLVPALLGIAPPDGLMPHIGTTDVYFGIDVAAVHQDPDLYRTLKSVLTNLNFKQTGEEPSFCWIREVDGMPVKVELFCPVENEEQGVRIQTKPFPESGSGLTALGILGLDLLERDKITIPSEGLLLDDRGIKAVEVTVCGLAMLMLLKGWALAHRTKIKDGYDVVWCLKALGPDRIAIQFREAGFHDHHVGIKALEFLESSFQTPEHTGPKGWAISSGFQGEEREREKRDAVGIVREFTRLCRGVT